MSVLAEILTHKRSELAGRRRRAPVEELLLGEGAAKSFVGQRLVEHARAAKVPVIEVPRRVLETRLHFAVRTAAMADITPLCSACIVVWFTPTRDRMQLTSSVRMLQSRTHCICRNGQGGCSRFAVICGP